MARSLGVTEAGDRLSMDALANGLVSRRLLLVLATFEQFVGAEPFLVELLATGRPLKVPVTSRTVFRLSGKQTYPVPPLTLPTSDRVVSTGKLAAFEVVQLFVTRSRAVLPAFVLTDATALATAANCRPLGGLPLAIERAAERSNRPPPPAMLARLDYSLPPLVRVPLDRPARQWTLRSAFGWSYDLLDEAER